MPHPNAEINQLLTDIELYSIVNDAQSYYMKAGALIKLRTAIKNGLYEKQVSVADILESFSRAIALDETNPLFVLDRCKFYNELAMEDLQKATLMPINSLIKSSVARYFDNVLAEMGQKLNPVPHSIPLQTGNTMPAQSSPSETFTQVSSVPQALFAAPVLPKNERLINELTEAIRLRECRTHPASLYQQGNDYMKLASLTQESNHIVNAIEWYSLAIKHEATQPLYYMSRANANLKLGKVYDAIVDTLSARTLPSARPAYHAYVCNMTKQFVIELKKLEATESFQLDSRRLDSEGKISIQDPHWIDNLELSVKAKAESTTMTFK